MHLEDVQKSKNLNEQQLRALLDHLDQQDASSPARDRRGVTRISFRKPKVRVRITQPGGGCVECDLPSRNLSSGGISLLYWAFLYNGTEIRVTLKRRTGPAEAIDGKVVWCKHVIGPHHSIGVRFNKKVLPKLYIDPSEWGNLKEDQHTDPSQLRGRVLFIDSQEMERLLFSHHMKATQLQVMDAADEETALRRVKDDKFDLICCDLNMQPSSGEQLIRKIRDAGYTGMLVAMTEENDPARLSAAQTAGANAILQKPYDADKLMGMIDGWLHGGIAPEEMIFSEMSGNPAMESLIGQYVTKVHQLAEKIVHATEAENLDLVRQICQTIKGSGGNFGFPSLSKAAKDAVSLLDTTKSVSAALAQIQDLEDLCRRVSAAPATSK